MRIALAIDVVADNRAIVGSAPCAPSGGTRARMPEGRAASRKRALDRRITILRLPNKVALVTGTSPNIGGGIAEELAAAGAAIIAVDLRPENAADCAGYLNRIGSRAIGLTCDVTKEDEVRKVVQSAIDAFGHIDILVNNAAFFNQKGVLDMSYDEWNAQTGVILG